MSGQVGQLQAQGQPVDQVFPRAELFGGRHRFFEVAEEHHADTAGVGPFDVRAAHVQRTALEHGPGRADAEMVRDVGPAPVVHVQILDLAHRGVVGGFQDY